MPGRTRAGPMGDDAARFAETFRGSEEYVKDGAAPIPSEFRRCRTFLGHRAAAAASFWRSCARHRFPRGHRSQPGVRLGDLPAEKDWRRRRRTCYVRGRPCGGVAGRHLLRAGGGSIFRRAAAGDDPSLRRPPARATECWSSNAEPRVPGYFRPRHFYLGPTHARPIPHPAAGPSTWGFGVGGMFRNWAPAVESMPWSTRCRRRSASILRGLDYAIIWKEAVRIRRFAVENLQLLGVYFANMLIFPVVCW